MCVSHPELSARLCALGLYVPELLAVGMAFRSSLTQVPMSTFIWRARRKALPERRRHTVTTGYPLLYSDATVDQLSYFAKFSFRNTRDGRTQQLILFSIQYNPICNITTI